MLIANIDRREYLYMLSSNEYELIDFVSKLLFGMTSTPPPPNHLKVHSFQSRWCAERVVGSYDLEQFERWLDGRGDSIEHYKDLTQEFVREHKMRCGPDFRC